MKPVIVHSEARAELDAAMGYYESQVKGLGLDLQSKVDHAVERIQEAPERWPRFRKTRFRKYHVERFPYIVYYLELPDRIWVVAIAHGKRKPGYWRGRKPE